MAKKTSTAPAVDLFAAAKVDAVVPEKPKAKKAEKTGIEMGDALQKVAAIDFLMASLKGQRETFEGMVKDEMADHFVEEGLAIGRRPENFKGVNGLGSASCELKKRSTASVLVEDEITALAEAGIETEEVEVTPEAYLFNPAIIADPALRAKLSAALAKIDFGGLQPIQYQPAVKKFVATETMIDKLFSSVKRTKTAAKLLSAVTTLSLKTKWSGDKKAALEAIAE